MKKITLFILSYMGSIFFYFIECFTTTFLRAHSWLNWVDEDDEVGLKEKPDTSKRFHRNKTRSTGSLWTKDLLINLIPIYCHHWDCGLQTSAGVSSLRVPTGV